MPIEFEAKFLDINETEYRNKLKKIGAKLVHPKKKLIRAMYLLCGKTTSTDIGYFRIRDEGDKVTLTTKTYPNIKFPEERELTIKESFEEAVKFAEQIGLKQKSYQESYREKWTHELAHEITIDTLPGLPTYTELDCVSKENLEKLIDILDLDKSKMRFGAFDRTYQEYYGIDLPEFNDRTPKLTFGNVINELHITKNKKLLEEIYKKQNGSQKLQSRNKKKSKKKSKRSKKKSKRSKKKSKH